MGGGPKKQVYLFYHIFCGFSKFRESYTNLLQNGCARGGAGTAVRKQQRAHVGGQGGAVQHVAARRRALRFGAAVQCVAKQRVADVGHVHTDLMRAAGAGHKVDKR